MVDVTIPSQPGEHLVATVATGGATARGGDARAVNEKTQPAEHFRVSCRLLIGADGGRSRVQRAMQAAQPGQGWERKVWSCPSGTQCWKVRACL